MAFTRSSLSLSNASTGVAVGRFCTLARPAVTRATMQVQVTGSTKAVVRMKGSVDGVTWVSLGAANSTFTTAGGTASTTSFTGAFRHLRVDQVSMTAKAGGQTVRAFVTGA